LEPRDNKQSITNTQTEAELFQQITATVCRRANGCTLYLPSTNVHPSVRQRNVTSTSLY